MNRPHSRRSDGSEAEQERLQEVNELKMELAKLQQSYRTKASGSKSFSEEAQNAIRKQKQAIRQLHREEEELLKELNLARSTQNQLKDKSTVGKLRTLKDKEAENMAKIEDEKEKIKNFDLQIKKMEKAKRDQHKNMGGVHMSQQVQVAAKKQVAVLENRLDQALKRFNSILADNKKKRELIDHLRQEKVIFENLFKKLEKELADTKKDIAIITEDSTAAYDQRDEAQAKMLALKEKSDKEMVQYNMELKNIRRTLEHDRKLKEFMTVKAQEREMDEESLARKRKKDAAEKAEKAEEAITTYEQAFEKIREVTSIQDTDKLVKRFIEVEDQNFALFNYVNELNNSIESIQEQINTVKDDISKFKMESVDLENERKKILGELEEKLETTNTLKGAYDLKYDGTMKTLDQLKSGIDSLFNKINCDRSPIVEMLGEAGVTETNMMQYLGIVEQRTNELLQLFAFVQAREAEKQEGAVVPQPPSLLGQGPQPQVNTITVAPPTTGITSSQHTTKATADDYESDGDSVDEEEIRPLTQAELKKKIIKGISKREALPKKGKKEKA